MFQGGNEGSRLLADIYSLITTQNGLFNKFSDIWSVIYQNYLRFPQILGK